jgi:hypothetical protein
LCCGRNAEEPDADEDVDVVGSEEPLSEDEQAAVVRARATVAAANAPRLVLRDIQGTPVGGTAVGSAG